MKESEAEPQRVRADGANAPAVLSGRFDSLGADGAPVRLGIMGGTFDPIHIGHLACAEQAREAYRLDAVIFVPTGNPAFKRDRAVTPAADRLAMCRLAVLPNPHFDVSDMEIVRGGVTYTVDTLRILRSHYPDNVELFFITGADSILSIARWRESAAIASLVRFIAVTRPGYAVTDEFKAELAALGDYAVDYLEVTALAVSSSDLRARVARGFSLRYLTTLSVCDYIHRNGLYRASDASALGAGTERASAAPVLDDGVHRAAATGGEGAHDAAEDPLGDAFFAARRADLVDRVSKKRLRHIEGVARAAEKLARTYGVDVRKARLAGLLHDWDKGYDDAGIRARVAELALDDVLDPWVVAHMPQVLHGPTAAAALGRTWPAIPRDVLQAIDRHTTAAVDMTPLDMVVYIADAIEESRQYGRIDELRALVGKVSLEELFFSTYEYWVILLIERGKPVHPATITVWNSYAARAAARKGKK